MDRWSLYWRRREPWSSLLAAAAVATVLLLYCTRFGLNSPPSATGDEPSYDSLGWELSHGRGFAENFADPEFRRPYDVAAQTDPELMTLPELPSGPVTYRPPLYPLLIAGTDRLCGRQFCAMRLINILSMAGTTALLVSWLMKVDGTRTALLGGGLCLVLDVRTRLYARAILTEALAALLLTTLTWLLWRLRERRDTRTAALAGLTLGLALLNRSAFVLWLPALVAGLSVLLWSGPPPAPPAVESVSESAGQRCRTILRLLAVLLAAAGLVYLPWAVRNIRLLGQFMPLGAQGLMELSAAFSDRALERQGVWFNLDSFEFFSEVDAPDMSRIERERIRAQWSRQQAVQWIRQHPWESLQLGGWKILHEYRPRSVPEWCIGGAAVLGAILSWRRRDTQLLLLLHLANATAIAVTWSVEGRFLVPLLFSIHVLAARGAYSLLSVLRRTLSSAVSCPAADPPDR